MSDQPEALRLAEYMDAPLNDPRDVADAAAAELRRLHAECDALQQIVADYPPIEAELREVSDRAFRAEAENERLRADAERWKGLFGEALDAFNSRRPTDIEWSAMRDMAREARAALKEVKP